MAKRSRNADGMKCARAMCQAAAKNLYGKET